MTCRQVVSSLSSCVTIANGLDPPWQLTLRLFDPEGRPGEVLRSKALMYFSVGRAVLLSRLRELLLPVAAFLIYPRRLDYEADIAAFSAPA